jgi:hypothetical protein
MKRRVTILVVLAGVLTTMMACTIGIGGPTYPTMTIPVSTQAVEDMQASIQTAVAESTVSGEITLTLT